MTDYICLECDRVFASASAAETCADIDTGKAFGDDE